MSICFVPDCPSWERRQSPAVPTRSLPRSRFSPLGTVPACLYNPARKDFAGHRLRIGVGEIMFASRRALGVLSALLLVAAAPAGETYRTRLSVVPLDVSMQANVA